MPTELRERFDGLTIVRETAPSGASVYRFAGPFQEMNDVRNNKNRNGRVYTKKLWEKCFADKDVQERLTAKRMLGELDHPADQGQIRRTSHIVTKIKPDYETGIIEGELELLNHNQGDAALIRALVDQGCKLCVSSRSYGDFLEDGRTIDPETFKLITWDIVLDPSVPIAQLNRIAESVNLKLEGDSKARTAFLERSANTPDGKEKIENNNSKELTVEQEKLLEANADLREAKARLEVNMTHMESLVKDKNTALQAYEAKVDKMQASINEALAKVSDTEKKLAEAVAKVAAADAALVEAKKVSDAKVAELKEYDDIEAKAVKLIESLQAKVAEYEKIGEEAADRIEALMAQIKERKNSKRRKGEAADGASDIGDDPKKKKKADVGGDSGDDAPIQPKGEGAEGDGEVCDKCGEDPCVCEPEEPEEEPEEALVVHEDILTSLGESVGVVSVKKDEKK